MRSPLYAVLPLVLLLLTPAAGAGPSPARVETFELPSPLVDTSTVGGELWDGRTDLKVNVLLPAGYDEHPRKRYPVLWLLHGANSSTDTWLGSNNNINELAAGLAAIVVMPDGGSFGMYTDWWNDGVRGNPAWIPYHLELLREEIGDALPDPARAPLARDRRHLDGRPGRAPLRSVPAGLLRLGRRLLRRDAGHAGPGNGGRPRHLRRRQRPRRQLRHDLRPGGRSLGGRPQPEGARGQLEHTRIYLTSGDGINCPQDPEGPNVSLDAITEAAINGLQGPFATAARAAGAKVVEVTTCGVHTFGVWDRAFPEARAWNFFKAVPKRPRKWTYRTIATEGEMWGLRFVFAEPPEAIVEFARSGRTLAATGSGSVQIEGDPGCELSAELPFELALPRACR